MERMGNKRAKTYGSKTTLDDLDLNRSVYEGSWEKDAVEDALDFLGEPKRKKMKGGHDTENEGPSSLGLQASPPRDGPTDGAGRADLHSNPRIAEHTGTTNPHAGNVDEQPQQGIATTEPLTDQASSNQYVTDQDQPAEIPADHAGGTEVEVSVILPFATVVHHQIDELARDSQSQEDQDELAGPAERVTPTCVQDKPSKPSRKDKKRKSTSGDQETFDPWADDPELPQEHYKPRRSRFRGGDVDELMEAIDFSKRPEAAFRTTKKSKISRRKTTGGAVVVHLDDKEGDLFDDVEEKPFEPAKSRASKTPIPSVEEDDDDVKEDGKPDLDLPKRKRGRPKKQAAQEPPSEADGPTIDEAKASEAAGAASERKANKRKKKKESTPSEVEDGEDAEEGMQDDEELSTEAEKLHQPDSPSKLELRARHDPSTPSPQKAAPEPLADKTNIVVAVPDGASAETPGREKEKVPARHSPLSGSTVRYRVGLSRRARIEPLLRIVKK